MAENLKEKLPFVGAETATCNIGGGTVTVKVAASLLVVPEKFCNES